MINYGHALAIRYYQTSLSSLGELCAPNLVVAMIIEPLVVDALIEIALHCVSSRHSPIANPQATSSSLAPIPQTLL